MRTVSSRQHPLVRAFRDAAESVDRERPRLLLDGLHLLRDAHAAGLVVEVVAATHRLLDGDAATSRWLTDLGGDGVDVVAVSDVVMAAMSPVRTPSGVVALAARAAASVEALAAHPRALIVATVDVQDPGNLGALLRAAEAGGATGAIVCGASPHPFSWKALRGSMGSALRLPIAVARTAQEALDTSRHHEVQRIASVARTGTLPDAIDWRRRSIAFVGGEGAGLPNDIASACDARVTIPMAEPVESLNVAVATALLVYEARRQRRTT